MSRGGGTLPRLMGYGKSLSTEYDPAIHHPEFPLGGMFSDGLADKPARAIRRKFPAASREKNMNNQGRRRPRQQSLSRIDPGGFSPAQAKAN
jgi:hypothetical protein